MSGNLLDRLLSPEPLAWRYTLRVFLITLAFHSPWLLMGLESIVRTMVNPHPLDPELVGVPPEPPAVGDEIFILVLPIICYWGIFLLALLSDPANPMHRWRVWVAWLLMTSPFAVLYFLFLYGLYYGEDTDGVAAGMITFMLIPSSPVIAVVGAVAGQLLWHLFRLLRTGLRKRCYVDDE